MPGVERLLGLLHPHLRQLGEVAMEFLLSMCLRVPAYIIGVIGGAVSGYHGWSSEFWAYEIAPFAALILLSAANSKIFAYGAEDGFILRFVTFLFGDGIFLLFFMALFGAFNHLG